MLSRAGRVTKAGAGRLARHSPAKGRRTAIPAQGQPDKLRSQLGPASPL